MARGIDRIRSLLPDTELILDARGEFMNVQGFYWDYNKTMKKEQFGKFLELFEKELKFTDECALKLRRVKLRFLENLNSVEMDLNKYKKQYKKVSKQHPAVKKQLQIIEKLLSNLKNIKKRVKNEIGRSIYDEKNLHNSI